jgi:hypothetical protein
MKRVFLILTLGALLAMSQLPAFAGELLDAVIATINHQPLLQSDWDEAVCFEAFMQQKPLGRLADADRIEALQRLIDRQLLEAQMGGVAYMQPSADELQRDVGKLRAQVPDGNDDQAWQKLLSSYGLTEEVLKQHLADEQRVMNFVEVRLRPNVHVPPEDVEAYYRNQLLPDLLKNGKNLPLNEVEPRIRELLTQQRIDELLDAWLHNLRQQSEIQTAVPLPSLHTPAEAVGAPGAN